jgi:hypothetical protein
MAWSGVSVVADERRVGQAVRPVGHDTPVPPMPQ